MITLGTATFAIRRASAWLRVSPLGELHLDFEVVGMEAPGGAQGPRVELYSPPCTWLRWDAFPA